LIFARLGAVVLDLTQTFFGVSLWLWMIGFLVIILLAIVVARKLEFEGVNITATPPFFTFRFKRKSALSVSAPASFSLPAAPPVVNVFPPPTAPPPSGSAAPPARTAHYVSRGKIQADVRAALESRTAIAVVGVAGMGGIGKTELARYLCDELEHARNHRVIWIGVYNRAVADLQNELARALGIGSFAPNATDQSRYEILLAAFHDNPCIVFFDDVYKSAIPALQFLLPPSPPCAALITSRQRELGGVVRVFELDVMTLDQSLELVREAHGLQDALAREPDATRELCRLCGYLPLALDIAASRLRKQLHFTQTPITAFNQALANRLKELQRGNKPERLDSVSANIALSYDDLDDADRRRLRALAVFTPSGFAPRAAAALWGEDEADARTSIERLQDGWLVMNAEAVGRFRLHDLVRDYAALKLNEQGEGDTANHAHAEFLIALFEEHHTDDLSNAPEVGDELENLRVAANCAREKPDGQLLARLATRPRNWLYNIFRVWDEWYGWLGDALRIGEDYKPDLRANVLKAMGDVQQFRKDMNTALQSYAQALELFRTVGDRLGEANVYLALGGIQRAERKLGEARENFRLALVSYQTVGDAYSQARALYRLGDCDADEKKWNDALVAYRRAAQIWNTLGMGNLVDEILKPRIENADKNNG